MVEAGRTPPQSGGSWSNNLCKSSPYNTNTKRTRIIAWWDLRRHTFSLTLTHIPLQIITSLGCDFSGLLWNELLLSVPLNRNGSVGRSLWVSKSGGTWSGAAYLTSRSSGNQELWPSCRLAIDWAIVKLHLFLQEKKKVVAGNAQYSSLFYENDYNFIRVVWFSWGKFC